MPGSDTPRTLTADLCDACDTAQVLPLRLTNYGAGSECVGPVDTVSTENDNSLVAEALRGPGKGRILVVDNSGSPDCAMVGGDLGRAAHDNGWLGIVVNGAIRDVVELREVPIGIFALASCPRKSIKRGIGVRGAPIECAGTIVRPGDIAAADPDGVIIVPADDYAALESGHKM